MLHSVARGIVATVVFCMAGMAGAGSTVFSGTVGPGGVKMPVVLIATPNCSAQGTFPVSFRAIPFRVTASGTYTFSESNADTAISLHSAAFDARTPFESCLTASNASPANLSRALTSGVEYVLVVTDDTLAQAGEAYSVTVNGPGDIDRQCAGFTDLDANSAFCFNAAWLKNRQVTLGCTSTTSYCPDGNVTRLQMAAFMNRLASALSPLFLHRAQTGNNASFGLGEVQCPTDALRLETPRVASLSSVMVFHRAASAVLVVSQMVYSVNGGSTWLDFGGLPTAATNVANSYASQSPAAAPLRLEAGQTVRFGVRPTPGNVPNDSGCELTVRLDGV